MASIQESGLPLVFAVEPNSYLANRLPVLQPCLDVRTTTRALEGMQKEAIVEYGHGGNIWRMACDEGPYLNGTDLAPFPLGFFGAGITASYMSAIIAEAKSRSIQIETLHVAVNNHYSMEGSALAGTMSAGVLPTTVEFSATGNTSDAEFADIADVGICECSAAHAVLASALPSGFAIRRNNAMLDHALTQAPECNDLSDPKDCFDRVQPTRPTLGSDIIYKAKQVEAAGDPPVGLTADQKRSLHVRAEGELRADGLKQITARCITPASSAFTFLSDDSALMGGQERAPSGLAYLSAGVAFCFMTQLGRYAQITKQKLRNYRIVQNTAFDISTPYKPSADAVHSLVCIDADESEENICKLVQMGEQTCYLHGAYRLATETVLR